MKKHPLLQGFLFLMLAQIMVGLSIVSSKLVLTELPVLVLLAFRFSIAALFLLPLHWTTDAKKIPLTKHFAALTRRDWAFLIGQALCAGILFNCLMMTGLRYTDANVAGIITSALPAIIALLAWIFLHEKISSQKSLCIGFATFGLFIIAYDKLGHNTISNSFLGDFLVLLSLLPEATYYILCKRYTNRMPLFLTSALLSGINAILLLPVLFLMPWHFNIPILTWVLVFIIGLTAALFFVFWFQGAKQVDGIMASLSTAVMPLATVVLAWIMLGEGLTSLQLVGMGLVIFSILLYVRKD